MASRPFRLVVVDLFCGGGGFSTGMAKAIVDAHREEIAAGADVDADTEQLRQGPATDGGPLRRCSGG